MEHVPIAPVIVASREELLLFRSAGAAAAYMEPIDVENGEYPEAWDAAGRPLALGVAAEPRQAFFGLLDYTAERVIVRLASTVPDEAGLRARIAVALGSAGAPLPASAPLASFVDALVARHGYVG